MFHAGQQEHGQLLYLPPLTFDDGQHSNHRRQSHLFVDVSLIFVTVSLNSVNHFFLRVHLHPQPQS